MKKIIYIGNVAIGDGKPVIQTMTNTVTVDERKTIEQVNALANAGAELVRVSVPDEESAKSIKNIALHSKVPIIADIHYSSKPALIAIENGAKKIRINPGNMSSTAVEEIVKKCIEYKIPIRVGVNKGSSENASTPRELAEKAIEYTKIIEDLGWDKIVVSVKSSDIRETVEAYRILNRMTDYPLHVGLTEAGTEKTGKLKSAIAIGALLLDGIGDTIRVSLACNPIKEVYAAKDMLRAIGIDKNFINVIACPTCARTKIDVSGISERMEEFTKDHCIPLKIAIMGCTVNGIGESKGADFGVAGGKERSALFENGKIIKTIPNEEIEATLKAMISEKINGKRIL